MPDYVTIHAKVETDTPDVWRTVEVMIDRDELWRLLMVGGGKVPQAPTAEEGKELKKTTEREEAAFSIMKTLIGGDNDGVMVPWDSWAPVGAKTKVGGQVYVFDGKDLRCEITAQGSNRETNS